MRGSRVSAPEIAVCGRGWEKFTPSHGRPVCAATRETLHRHGRVCLVPLPAIFSFGFKTLRPPPATSQLHPEPAIDRKRLRRRDGARIGEGEIDRLGDAVE